MDHSYLFFGGCKIVEVVFAFVCFVFDIRGVTAEETVPNPYLWCIAYGLFTLIAVVTAAVFLITRKGTRFTKYITKISISIAVSTSVSSLFYLVMGLMQMYVLNKDAHLDEIPDEEEYYHEFFQKCMTQSVLNMVTALVFLVDTIIQADVMCQKRRRRPMVVIEGVDERREVEIEPYHEMDFNCWPTSIPRWCRDLVDECASWWRVVKFRMRMRGQRREQERAQEAAGPSGIQQSAPQTTVKVPKQTKVVKTVGFGGPT